MREALRAFLTMGGARAINVVLVVLRAKVIAHLLGAEGIGLLGIFSSVQEIAAQAADGGLSHSAVRALARARNSARRAARLRRALSVAVTLLGLAGATVLWLLRHEISELVIGDASQAAAFGLLSAGVLTTALFRWQQSLLAGYQRLADLSRMVVMATALATLAGIAVIWALGTDGLIWAALAVPAAGLAIAPVYTSRLPRLAGPWPRRRVMFAQWRGLLKIGMGLMVVSLMVLMGPLVLRIWLTAQAGLAEAGYFQSAWVISTQLMTVMMGAVSMDYYPRLCNRIADQEEAARLVVMQIRIHLALGGPVLLGLISFAPLILELLYTPAFVRAGALLQWIMLGNLLRLAAVPIETVLTAQGRTLVVLVLNAVLLGMMLLLAGAGYSTFGLAAIGIAFAAAQSMHLVLVSVVVARSSGIRLTPRTGHWLIPFLLAAVGLIGLGHLAPAAAMVAGALAAAGAGLTGLRQIGWLSGAPATTGAPGGCQGRPRNAHI